MNEAPDTERLIALGIAGMFGSLLVHGLLAALVGRLRRSFGAGLAAGMVLFGLTALGIGAYVAWVLFGLSVEVAAKPAGCEDLRPAGAEAALQHRLLFVARDDAHGTRADGPAEVRAGVSTRLATAPMAGRCPAEIAEVSSTELGEGATRPSASAAEAAHERRTPEPADSLQGQGDGASMPVTLRYRRAAAAAGAGPIPAERVDDPRQASIAVGVFAAFGGFWFLAGLTMLASRWEAARPAVPRPVSAWRERWSTTFTVVGNLLVVGCIVGASLTDWDAERSTRFAFRGVALGCVFFAAALALRRRLTLSMALTLLVIGGGFTLAAWSLDVLG